MHSRRLKRLNNICLPGSRTAPHPTPNGVSRSVGSVIYSQYAGRRTECRVVARLRQHLRSGVLAALWAHRSCCQRSRENQPVPRGDLR